MKTKIHSMIIMLATAAALAGCATGPAARINVNQQLFATIAPADQELIKQGKIALGFTPDMVLLALGKPDATMQRTDATGASEIWRWQNVDDNTSVYITGAWGGPAFSPGRGGWGWGGTWATPAWGWSTTMTDYLRVSFRNGRVNQIDRLR